MHPDLEPIVNHQEISNSLPQQIEYEHCPNCSRRFFEGKLQLHLKLCSPLAPMLLPQRIARQPLPRSSRHAPCPHCKAQLPGLLLSSHITKCSINNPTLTDVNFKPKEEGDRETVDLKKEQESQFPKVRRQELKTKQREKGVSNDLESPRRYRVRVREELSCLRLAERVQKVECPSCSRMFAKQAAERHIPICQKLTQQHYFQELLQKKKSRKKEYPDSSPVSPRRNPSLLGERKQESLPPLQVNQSALK